MKWSEAADGSLPSSSGYARSRSFRESGMFGSMRLGSRVAASVKSGSPPPLRSGTACQDRAELAIRVGAGLVRNIALTNRRAVAEGKVRSFVEASQLYHAIREERGRAGSDAALAQRSRKDRTARFDRPEGPMQIEALVGRYLAEPTRSRMAETIPSCKKSAGSLWSSSIATRCGWRRRFITRGSRSRCTAFSMM